MSDRVRALKTVRPDSDTLAKEICRATKGRCADSVDFSHDIGEAAKSVPDALEALFPWINRRPTNRRGGGMAV